MLKPRLWIVILGFLMPYLARIPGLFVHGPTWLSSYISDSWVSFLWITGLGMVCWGSILLGSLTYQHPKPLWFLALMGFVPYALMHATLDLSADPQSSIALIFIPLYTLPSTIVGWMMGQYWNNRLNCNLNTKMV